MQGLQGGLPVEGMARQVVRREAQPGRTRKNEPNVNKNGNNNKCEKGKKGRKCRRDKKRSKKSSRKSKVKQCKEGDERTKCNKNKDKKSAKRSRKQGTRNHGSGRQITGNATSCVMKLVKYARLNDKKASALVKQVGASTLVSTVIFCSGEKDPRQRQDPGIQGEQEGRLQCVRPPASPPPQHPRPPHRCPGWRS